MNHNQAGHILTKHVPTASAATTIAELQQLLKTEASTFESINYIYVVDHTTTLIGVVTVKELFRQPAATALRTIMKTAVITARAHTPQERVVYLALKHNLKAIPIVDEAHHLLGVVTNDVILTTLYREANADLLHLVGVHRAEAAFDNVLKIPLRKSLRHRLPWLFLGLLGGVAAASVIGRFEQTLEQTVLLAAFIPLVVYMADAVGTQIEAFIIRDLAINPDFNFWRYLWRQLVVVTCIGGITSAALFGLNWLIYHDSTLGIVLGITLFCAIVSSVITGLVVPYLFSKLKFDPANASGPIATIIQDLLSVTIYFTIAAWLL